MNIEKKYCGYITIIGKSNVGKSTLLNHIVGKKISIVSRKKNTTQTNIIGVKTHNCYQSIYIDTPGIIFDKKHNFYQIAKNVVLIIFVIDRIYWTEYDEIIFNKIKKNNIPIMIVINKIDKSTDKTILLPFINFLKNKLKPIEIVPISAKKEKNIIWINDIIHSYLPEKPHIYDKNYITTNSKLFTISEMIREQLILCLGDELPSIVKVTIESLNQNKEKQDMDIKAIIWVENTGQKRIIIGHSAKKIKKIGIISRQNIEKEFCIKTHLMLWVKIKCL